MDDTTIRRVSVAELSLGADARSPGAARRFLFSTLSTWGQSHYGEDAALLLSELVTNAALHARTQIVVRIELKAECLRVGVTDSSPRHPAVRHYSEQSTTGRGLALVGALAQRWGIQPHPDGTKTVWAELDGNAAQHQPEETVIDLRPPAPREDAGPSVEAGQDETPACRRAA